MLKGRAAAVHVACVAALTLACSGSGEETAAPGVPGLPPGAPTLPVSVVAVPIEIDLAAFATAANAALPAEDIAKGRWQNDPRGRYRWQHAVRRSPVAISMTGSILTATATLDYQLKACGPWLGNACPITVSCGWHDTRFDPPSKEGHIAIHSVLRLTPEYRVSSSTSAGPFVYNDANRCILTFLGIDATPLVARFIAQQMDDISDRLDQDAQRRLDFRAEAERAWTALQQPIDLGQGASLLLHPEAISAAPIRGSGSIARTSLGISARPVVVYGLVTSASSPAPLPPLALATPAEGFRISLPVHLGFDSLSASLTREVRGLTFSRGKLLGLIPLTATVERVRLVPHGDSVAAEVSLRGLMTGAVRLTAKPRYDPATGRVVLDGLDYDLEKAGVITRTAGWLLRSGLRDALERHATWEAAPEISAMRQRLDDALERELAPGVVLSGEIHSLDPIGDGVYPSDAALTILLEAAGVLRASVTLPGGP